MNYEIIIIPFLLIFGAACGFLIGYEAGEKSSRRKLKYRIARAEQKIQLAEDSWGHFEQHKVAMRKEWEREQRLERLKHIQQWDFVEATIPTAIPKDFNP